MGTAALAAHYSGPNHSLENALTFLAAMFLATAVHQLAPALVAWLGKLHVVRIQIGGGRMLLGGTIRATNVALHLIPYAGATQFSSPPKPRLALRGWLVIAAGPLGVLLVSGAIFVIGGYQWADFHTTWRPGWMPGQLVMFNFALLAALDLLPLRGTTLHKLIAIARRPDEHVANVIASHYYAVIEPYVKTDRVRALELIESALVATPGHVALEALRAALYLELKDYRRSEAASRALLARVELPPPVHKLVLHQFAWSCAMLGGPLLADADDASAKALAASPLDASVMNTRGVVLVELGKLDEGHLLLERALEIRIDGKHSEYDLLWLAIAEARRGNADVARDFLARALAIDPAVSGAERARDAIAAISPAT
jgi:tetratricopeptide (TPR) repeat protein